MTLKVGERGYIGPLIWIEIVELGGHNGVRLRIGGHGVKEVRRLEGGFTLHLNGAGKLPKPSVNGDGEPEDGGFIW